MNNMAREGRGSRASAKSVPLTGRSGATNPVVSPASKVRSTAGTVNHHPEDEYPDTPRFAASMWYSG
jgi:hypothetical protein